MRTATPTLNLLTVKQLAELLQVRERKIYDLVHHGGLPFLQLGRFFRFRPADVDRWLERATTSEAIPGESANRPKLPSYDWSHGGRER